MSWLFSQALVEAFSGASSSDGEPSAPLSVMPTPHKFWRNDKMMDASKLSQFGLTCVVLTEDRGAALLTSFLEASHARTSAQQARAQESTGNALASGLNLLGSLARFDPASSSWKTPQCSLVEGLDRFSETWPRWGSMRNGASWARMTPALPTVESGSGSWATPTVQDANGRDRHNQRDGSTRPSLLGQARLWPTPRANAGTNRRTKPTPAQMEGKAGMDLSVAVRMWPTPLATDGKNGGPNSRGSKGDLRLSAAVHQFPTPCARDYRSPNLKPFSERGGGRKGEQLVNHIAHFPTPRAASKTGGGIGLDGGSRARKAMVERFGEEEMKALGGGQLNPPWVEWLLGWPIGWTDLKPLETARFQQWPHSHSEPSTAA